MAERVVQRQYVLDAGALIAVERRSRRMAALLEVSARHRIEMIVPSTVLAQVWRHGSKQALLARSLRNPGILEAPLRHDDAKLTGELLGSSATTDIVDAHVVVLAGRLEAPVITSGPGDIARLDDRLDLITV